ncbi:hypothetical protein FQA39_LY08530 [Lamprigera yunnana]|nr:hypothetical protein FQA39_LY08530 [Lamprigera yunnana]
MYGQEILDGDGHTYMKYPCNQYYLLYVLKFSMSVKMHQVLVLCFLLCVVILQDQTMAYAQEEYYGDDYALYANMYNDVADEIGEEPIQIVDIIKAMNVFDSDDKKSEQSTILPTEQGIELL